MASVMLAGGHSSITAGPPEVAAARWMYVEASQAPSARYQMIKKSKRRARQVQIR